ncbi:alpha,alpha-trehalase TreF [Ramlibacter sp.]|uniref:alpha,alpha-trehalase TreF n=1 Tax=Ramlibacter sp. TaxID=1917967 RepID=UPI0026139280|nr:alpha,alpha-trehalase TreF [Ramlibacter sp.]MDB5956137.1 Alpha,alpha-trehalase [Ramlibacter sp.]
MKTPLAHPHARHAAAAAAPPPDILTPADRYQELFETVQREAVFADSKTFVDCAPRDAPEAILARYRAQRHAPGFDLRRFVRDHFGSPRPAHADYVPVPGQTIAQHIDSLWPFLAREPHRHPVRGSLLQLPHCYIVPGGRFVELYYWDSYFTMLGLAESGQADMLHCMTDNFAHLVDAYGHVPNGTRTYYLSRSQPPVFALMVQLCEARGGPPALHYLPQLLREHEFWLDGAHDLPPGQARRRVVRLPDGALLNRYWDDRCTPREESWREDMATAARSGRPHAEVWRHLRAAAESGWDFSTRWLADRRVGLPSICTTDLLPVDLNAFLHELEATIARLARAAADPNTADAFERRANARAAAIDRYFWSPAGNHYADWNWRTHRRRELLSAATMVPLFCGLASQPQARALERTVRARLLAPGGLATTEHGSGEQWDRPNGWAPLQWLAVEGLARYGCHHTADEIRARWMHTVQVVYDREHRLVEKYALRDAAHAPAGGDGGEYPLQDGFGWTNGVVRRWITA